MTDKAALHARMRDLLKQSLAKHDTAKSWWDVDALEKTQPSLMPLIYDAMIAARNEALEEAAQLCELAMNHPASPEAQKMGQDAARAHNQACARCAQLNRNMKSE